MAARVEAQPGVEAVAPFTALEGMLASSNSVLSPAVVRGIVPTEEAAVSQLEQLLTVGSLGDLQAGAQRIVLGRFLAASLGVGVGERITLLAPAVENGRLTPRLTSFIVSGLFQAGIREHDVGLALVHLDDASRLKGLGARPQSLGIRLRDPLAAGQLQQALQRDEPTLQYTDWTLQNRSYFRAINIEKTMMTVLLMLIVAVAAFNVVASLTMTVTDRHKDIAILRTHGLAAGRVARIFVVQGSILGLAGTLIGVVLGSHPCRECGDHRPVAGDGLQFPHHAWRRLLRHRNPLGNSSVGPHRGADSRPGGCRLRDDLSGTPGRGRRTGRSPPVRTPMRQPYEISMAVRYLRVRGRNGFISFISLVSMVGIGLAVAVLIVVLSVMNGFEYELRQRILNVLSHATISGAEATAWRIGRACASTFSPVRT